MLTSISTAGMPAARAPSVCPPGVPKGQRTMAWGRQRRINETSGAKKSMDFCASARSAAKSSGVASGTEPKPHLARQTTLKPSKAGVSRSKPVRGDTVTDARDGPTVTPAEVRASLTAVASDSERNVDGGRAPRA